MQLRLENNAASICIKQADGKTIQIFPGLKKKNTETFFQVETVNNTCVIHFIPVSHEKKRKSCIPLD